MTKRILKKYSSLSALQKTALILFTLTLLIGSSIMIAVASGVTFNGNSPAEGTIVAAKRPNIAVNVVADGVVDSGNVKMLLDENAVDATLTSLPTPGNYIVSYTPAIDLTDGDHRVDVEVYDPNDNSSTSTKWSFNVETAPRLSGKVPAQDAVINAGTATISLNVKDTFDRLNSGSVSMKVGGQAVTPNFKFKGHYEYDSCGGSYWVIDSYKEGSISYYARNLKDGRYTVEVSIADEKGNVVTENWSFDVKYKPRFTGATPANGALINTTSATTVSVKVTDDTAVDPDSVKMEVNGGLVAHNYDSTTGIISYNATLGGGNHNVKVSASDTAGNSEAISWAFDISEDAAPKALGFVPANGGSVNTPNPKLSATIKDTYDNLNSSTITMKIDGKSVTPSFKYKGHWYSDSCGAYYVIDSYKEGTVEYQASGLTDGRHEVEISIKDARGNLMTEKWSFTIGTAPKFSGFSPANKSESNNPRISVVVSDGNPINWSTLVMKVDNNPVNPVIDEATGTVTYEGSLTDGVKTVSISVADEDGNVGSTSWQFTYDTAGPNLEMFFLYHQGTPNLTWSGYRLISGGGITLLNGILSVEMRLKDVVDISKAELFVDGQLLDSQLKYPSKTDSCSGVVTITTRKEGYVLFNKPVNDGEHILTLNLEDKLGNKRSYSWPLVVTSKPFVKDVTPIEYGLKNQTPKITAKLTDNNGTINADTVVVKLNGTQVEHAFDSNTGIVSYQVTEALADESYHTVTVTAADNAGLQVERTWKFYVNAKGYPEMSDSSPANCSACHGVGENALQSAYHRGVPFSGDHGTAANGCYDCHMYISYPADCAQCHGDVDFDYAPHGSTPTIKYSLQKFDPNMPQRVKENREVFDCILCHQPGSRAGATVSPVIYKDQWGYNVPTYNEYGELVVQTEKYWSRANYNYTSVLNNHDIPDLHKAPDSGCSDCHAQSLTREHARPGRVDANNQTIDCNTCHKSTNEKVKTAIATNNKACTACHDATDHESLHESTLDANCQTCHAATLTREHMSNEKTTALKGYDCNTCHASDANQVKRTIGANSLNCAGCHTEGHNMNFVDKIPGDIPLHSEFQWTTPIEASIFTGEPSTPADYTKGQVVLSSRSQAVTVSDMWTYYHNELTKESYGWILKSPVPSAGAQSFMVEFEKEGRFITVQGYNTANRDNTGSVIGTKLEIWYK